MSPSIRSRTTISARGGRRRGRLSRPAMVTVLLAAVLAVIGGSQVDPSPAEAVRHTRTFDTWGVHTYTVPPGVHVLEVTAVGAPGGQGGWGVGGNGFGGGGGRFEGLVDVTPGEELTIFVGQQGFSGTTSQQIGLPGLGWAVGGPGNTGSVNGGAGGGGGGASAVASGGDVLVVAGGGGGGGGGGVALGVGGNGGEAGNRGVGGSGSGAGAGGNGYVTSPAGGVGGNAETLSGGGGGGGGGGGWTGGRGGGGADWEFPGGSSGGGGGGAGGSNYRDPGRIFGDRWGVPSRTVPAFVSLSYDVVYDTTTSVTFDEPEIYVGDSAEALVLVEAPQAPTSAAGTVEIFVGSVSLGPPQGLAEGMLRLTIDDLPPGDHDVRAVFTAHDPADFNPSAGTARLSVVEGTAQVLLASDRSPSASGQQVTFTASVASIDPPSVEPSGGVQFLVDGAEHGAPVPLNHLGQASIQVSDLAVGSRMVTARYEGDELFGASVSDPLVQQVNPGDVAVVVDSSSNPSVSGEEVEIDIRVAPIDPAEGTPSGTIDLLVDGVVRGESLDLDVNGETSISIDDLPVGSHELVARYSGDGSFDGASSSLLTQIVNQGELAVALAPAGAASGAGEEVSFDVEVAVVSPAVGTPTGSVHLFAGEKPVGEPVEVSADGETLVLSSSTLPVGLNHLTARYTGDDRFVPAISNPVEHVVNPGDTEVALTSSAPDTELGEEVTFEVTVAPNAPLTRVPTGAVTFEADGAVLGTPVVLDATGSASFTTDALSVGSHQVSAQYSGDETFAPASTAVLRHTVHAPEEAQGVDDPDGHPASARMSYPGGGPGGEGAGGHGSNGLPVTGAALFGSAVLGTVLLVLGAILVGGGGRFRRLPKST